jgi:hypothetical protein
MYRSLGSDNDGSGAGRSGMTDDGSRRDALSRRIV